MCSSADPSALYCIFCTYCLLGTRDWARSLAGTTETVAATREVRGSYQRVTVQWTCKLGERKKKGKMVRETKKESEKMTRSK